MKAHSQKFLKQRRFFMVLPLLVLPFLIMILWVLGVGKATPANAEKSTGLLLTLPEPHFSEDHTWDKFELYERAKRDSLKKEEARKNDPYYRLATLTGEQEKEQAVDQKAKKQRSNKLILTLGTEEEAIDPNEKKVNEKLEELRKGLESTHKPQNNDPAEQFTPSAPAADDANLASDVDRLEEMMLLMQEGSEEDPEMQRIERVLEKILDIQHPERVKERLREKNVEDQPRVFSVSASREKNISLLENPTEKYDQISVSRRNGFYGLNDEDFGEAEAGNAIEAVVHDTQELASGSTIKLRLLNDIYINGMLIPEGRFIHGTCRINNERLIVSIESIRVGNSLLPVAMSVYDLDGLEGIYIPGAITRDVARQSTNQAIRDLQLFSYDPSVSEQAASAGIEAVKELMSKKTKMVKVTVKAGYKILLKDKNSQV